jgi:hypothetical protein
MGSETELMGGNWEALVLVSFSSPWFGISTDFGLAS